MQRKAVSTAIASFLVLTSILIGASTSVTAITADSNKSTDVNVTITSEVALDVEPKTLQYTGVNIGEQVKKTDRQFRGITIENTGSEYIDKIWANASVPTSRPFGTGLPSAYDAGNFLQIKPNMSDQSVSGAAVSNYYYVNRREFKVPDSSVPAYIVAPEDQITLPSSGQTVADVGGEVHVGRFRRGDEALWFIIATPETNGGDDDCDGVSENGDSMIRIGNISSTPSRLGAVDFTDDGPAGENAHYEEYQIQEVVGSNKYGVTGRTVELKYSTKTLKYDVLTHCSGSNTADTVRTRFGVDAMDTNDLTSEGHATEFIVNAGNTASNMLLPGDTIPLKTAVQIPTGVSEGEVSLGTLTLFATANTTAQK